MEMSSGCPGATGTRSAPPPARARHAAATWVWATSPSGARCTARHAPALAGPTNSHTALRGLPCQHWMSSRRAAGLRARSQAMSGSPSRVRAYSIERYPAEPGSPSRLGSTEPVAP